MSQPSAFTVPTIDISPYILGVVEDQPAVSRAFDEAASTVGFVQIVGHGISSESWAGLGRASDRFFGLSLEQKKRYCAAKGVNRGYSPPKTERLSLSLGVEKAERMNDFFEAFNVGTSSADYPGSGVDPAEYPENVWPTEADAFRDDVEVWMSDATSVAQIMMEIFADALELPKGYFDEYTDHSLNLLRMNNYALPEGERVDLDGDLIGMGEHTDFGIVTLLWADDVMGLQVLAEDGSWNDVSPNPGALLVNLGDVTARWTNEKWKSTLHRVKPPVIDGLIKRRRSAAFFLDGNLDAVISTLPGCIDTGGIELYEPITVGEHISAKLRGSRGLEKNTADVAREAQRVLTSRY